MLTNPLPRSGGVKKRSLATAAVVALSAASLVQVAGPASAETSTYTTTLAPIADTYVTSREPNTDHGLRPYSYANTDESVGLLAFDTSSVVPSGYTISKVQLKLFVQENYQPSGTPIVSKDTYDWREYTTTLNSRSTRSTDDVSQTANAPAGQWTTIPLDSRSVTAGAVSALQVRYSKSHSTFRYASRETSQAPKLLVELTPTAQAASAVAPVAEAVTTSSAPSLARNAGFYSLAFGEEFGDLSGVDLTGRGVAGKNWYIDRPFGQNLSTSDLSVSDGVLTVNQTSAPESNAISSVSRNTGQGKSFQYGYFEVRMKFDESNSVKSAGFPALWMVPRGQVNGTAPTSYPELDVFEAYQGGYETSPHWFVGSVHDWFKTSGTHYMNSGNNIYKLSSRVNLNEFHTYSLRWSKGLLIWYFDGQAVLRQTYGAGVSPVPNHYNLPNGSFSMLDQQTDGMVLLLGSGQNYPMQVDWVRVWR